MSDTKLKTREPLTTRQRTILLTFYNQNPYPSASERHQLVQITGRTSKQVQDWFANRRRSDPKLASNKSTAVSQTTSRPTTSTMPEINYYFNLPPPPPPCVSSVCPCCNSVQSYMPVNESISPIFYPPTMPYYSTMDYYHS